MLLLVVVVVSLVVPVSAVVASEGVVEVESEAVVTVLLQTNQGPRKYFY